MVALGQPFQGSQRVGIHISDMKRFHTTIKIIPSFSVKDAKAHAIGRTVLSLVKFEQKHPVSFMF